MSNFTLFNVFMHSRRDHSAACQQEAQVSLSSYFNSAFLYHYIKSESYKFAIVKIFKTVEASYFDLVGNSVLQLCRDRSRVAKLFSKQASTKCSDY